MDAIELQALLEPFAATAGVAIPPGWLILVADCHKQLVRIHPDYRILQIKEKFGGLRYYTSPIPTDRAKRFNETISRFEDKSFQTCQTCGKVGALVTIGHWYYTLCQEHEEMTRQWRKEQWQK